MVEDKSYWAEEFVENAVMLLAKVASGQLVVQGDATVGPSVHAEVSFGGSGSQPPPPGPPGPRRQPPPPGPPPDDGGRRGRGEVAGSRTPRNRGLKHDLSPGGHQVPQSKRPKRLLPERLPVIKIFLFLPCARQRPGDAIRPSR